MCGQIDTERLLAEINEIKPSKYDYRLYFRSGRLGEWQAQ